MDESEDIDESLEMELGSEEEMNETSDLIKETQSLRTLVRKVAERRRKIQDQELMLLKKQTPLELCYSIIAKPRKALPSNPLPRWELLKLEDKIPLAPAPHGTFVLTRSKLSTPVFIRKKQSDFDLSDPYLHETVLEYNPLNDPNLQPFFESHCCLIKSLIKKGLLTPEGEVTCSLASLNKYRKYLSRIHKSEVLAERKRQIEVKEHGIAQKKHLLNWTLKEIREKKNEISLLKRIKILKENEERSRLLRKKWADSPSNNIEQRKAIERSILKKYRELKRCYAAHRMSLLRKAQRKKIRRLITQIYCKEDFSRRLRKYLCEERCVNRKTDLQNFIDGKRKYQEEKIRYHKALLFREVQERRCKIEGRKRRYDLEGKKRNEEDVKKILRERRDRARRFYLMKKYGMHWLTITRRSQEDQTHMSSWHLRNTLQVTNDYLREISNRELDFGSVVNNLLLGKDDVDPLKDADEHSKKVVGAALNKIIGESHKEIMRRLTSCLVDYTLEQARTKIEDFVCKETVDPHDFQEPKIPKLVRNQIRLPPPEWPTCGPCAEFRKGGMGKDCGKVLNKLESELKRKLSRKLEKNLTENYPDGGGATDGEVERILTSAKSSPEMKRAIAVVAGIAMDRTSANPADRKMQEEFTNYASKKIAKTVVDKPKVAASKSERKEKEETQNEESPISEKGSSTKSSNSTKSLHSHHSKTKTPLHSPLASSTKTGPQTFVKESDLFNDPTEKSSSNDDNLLNLDFGQNEEEASESLVKKQSSRGNKFPKKDEEGERKSGDPSIKSKSSLIRETNEKYLDRIAKESKMGPSELGIKIPEHPVQKKTSPVAVNPPPTSNLDTEAEDDSSFNPIREPFSIQNSSIRLPKEPSVVIHKKIDEPPKSADVPKPNESSPSKPIDSQPPSKKDEQPQPILKDEKAKKESPDETKDKKESPDVLLKPSDSHPSKISSPLPLSPTPSVAKTDILSESPKDTFEEPALVEESLANQGTEETKKELSPEPIEEPVKDEPSNLKIPEEVIEESKKIEDEVIRPGTSKNDIAKSSVVEKKPSQVVAKTPEASTLEPLKEVKEPTISVPKLIEESPHEKVEKLEETSSKLDDSKPTENISDKIEDSKLKEEPEIVDSQPSINKEEEKIEQLEEPPKSTEPDDQINEEEGKSAQDIIESQPQAEDLDLAQENIEEKTDEVTDEATKEPQIEELDSTQLEQDAEKEKSDEVIEEPSAVEEPQMEDLDSTQAKQEEEKENLDEVIEETITDEEPQVEDLESTQNEIEGESQKIGEISEEEPQTENLDSTQIENNEEDEKTLDEALAEEPEAANLDSALLKPEDEIIENETTIVDDENQDGDLVVVNDELGNEEDQKLGDEKEEILKSEASGDVDCMDYLAKTLARNALAKARNSLCADKELAKPSEKVSSGDGVDCLTLKSKDLVRKAILTAAAKTKAECEHQSPIVTQAHQCICNPCHGIEKIANQLAASAIKRACAAPKKTSSEQSQSQARSNLSVTINPSIQIRDFSSTTASRESENFYGRPEFILRPQNMPTRSNIAINLSQNELESMYFRMSESSMSAYGLKDAAGKLDVHEARTPFVPSLVSIHPPAQESLVERKSHHEGGGCCICKQCVCCCKKPEKSVITQVCDGSRAGPSTRRSQGFKHDGNINASDVRTHVQIELERIRNEIDRLSRSLRQSGVVLPERNNEEDHQSQPK